MNALTLSSCLLLLTISFGLQAASKAILNIGVPNEFQSTDPRQAATAQDRFILQLLYLPLVRVDEEQNLVPALADSWKVETGTGKIVFQIAKNYHFSDGAAVTTKDLIASLIDLCKSNAAADLIGLSGCDGKQAADPKIRQRSKWEIEFSIETNPAIFLYQLASSRIVLFRSAVRPAPLPSGPYTIIEYGRKQAKFRPNIHFAYPDRVHNGGFDLYLIPERDFKNAIEILKPDATLMFRASVVGEYKLRGYHMVKDRPTISEILVPNNQRAPFSNRFFRQELLAYVYNQSNLSECSGGSTQAFGLIPEGLVLHQISFS